MLLDRAAVEARAAEEKARLTEFSKIMDCAAQLPDDWLMVAETDYGSIDVTSKCATMERGTPFKTSWNDIKRERTGKADYAQLFDIKGYSLLHGSLDFLVGFFVTMILGLLALLTLGQFLDRHPKMPAKKPEDALEPSVAAPQEGDRPEAILDSIA